MREKVFILGAGEQAREILDVFMACNQESDRYEILGMLDDSPDFAGQIVNGIPVLGGLNHLATLRARDFSVIAALGHPKTRRLVVQKALGYGVRFCNAVHPSAVLTPFVELGQGVMVTAGCIFTDNIKVGNHVLVNLGATISHDVIIGDFCTLSPGVHLSGKVVLGEGCEIGTGTVVIPRTQIGEWTVTGAGAAVTRSLPANVTAVGVPARTIKTREPGWHDRWP